MDIQKKFLPVIRHILIAPLDWGIGHASRCIPLIRTQLSLGHRITLASNGRSAALLRQEFPQLNVLDDIPDYDIRYPRNEVMWWYFVKRTPALMRVVTAENHWLNNLISVLKIDEVYSDNRYGLYHSDIPCHLITHQLNIPGPYFLRPMLKWQLKKYINRFTDVLVPDHAGKDNLSGQLSHGISFNRHIHFIGPMSRFAVNGVNITTTNEKKYAFTAIISGPEPHRSDFENQVTRIFAALPEPTLIICGRPDENFDITEGRVRKVSHLQDQDFVDALFASRRVICRSGYSTLMDLDALGIRAWLVPTPGQAEQQYLARYHSNKGHHQMVEQSSLLLFFQREKAITTSDVL